VAYLNRTITLRFDGESLLDGIFADDDGKPLRLPNLGDDVWVVVRNPLLMPQALLTPKREVALNPDGTPVNRAEGIQAGTEVIAGLIASWNLTDVLADNDDVVPITPEALLNQVPAAVGDIVGQVVARARRVPR
jgi:hypothetical protein